jgi:hypothetical protein
MVDLAVQAGLVNMLERNAGAERRSYRLFGTPVFYIQRPDRILQPPASMPQRQPEPKDDGADPAGVPPDKTQVLGSRRNVLGDDHPDTLARPPRLAPPPGELPKPDNPPGI